MLLGVNGPLVGEAVEYTKGQSRVSQNLKAGYVSTCCALRSRKLGIAVAVAVAVAVTANRWSDREIFLTQERHTLTPEADMLDRFYCATAGCLEIKNGMQCTERAIDCQLARDGTWMSRFEGWLASLVVCLSGEFVDT